jgi:hypothetical protein
MTIAEEVVTRSIATALSLEGWNVIAVHPPDGQGPFVVPREPTTRAIERSSFHPDIVCVRGHSEYGAEVLIGECKPSRGDLEDDLQKIRLLVESRQALLFILFRCQGFRNGPDIGVDYEKVCGLETKDLPIRFILACAGPSTMTADLEPVGGLPCTLYEIGLDGLI